MVMKIGQAQGNNEEITSITRSITDMQKTQNTMLSQIESSG